jgi:glucose uptake protein GlcU
MIPTIPLQSAGGVLFIGLIFFLIGLALTYWVFQDAKKNSQQSAFLWALVVFLAPLLGLVLYFLLGRKGGRGRGHRSSQI